MTMIDDATLVRRERAAELLGVSAQTLRRWHSLGRGPNAIKIGPRAVGYRHADLVDFINSAAARVPA